MWVFCAPEKNIALYKYHPSRGGKVASEMLQGFSGYLQSDGYSPYNAVDTAIRVGCWAHGAEDWCEWQANTLGAALLMPVRTVHFWMYRFNGNKPLVRYGRRFNYMDRGVLDNLINVLAVSRTALVIRLTQLGYICQRPESEYCDPLDVYPDPGEVF